MIKQIDRHHESDLVCRLIDRAERGVFPVSLKDRFGGHTIRFNDQRIEIVVLCSLSSTYRRILQSRAASMLADVLIGLDNRSATDRLLWLLWEMDVEVVESIADALFCSALYHDSGGFLVPLGMIRWLPESDTRTMSYPSVTLQILLSSVASCYDLDLSMLAKKEECGV